MLYRQPKPKVTWSPDLPDRKVLVALEAFDPLSQTLVSEGLVVLATGLGLPIVSWSGRFVWLGEDTAWPSKITVEPLELPFEYQELPLAKLPANAKPEQRLVRMVLRPTAAADFSDVTAIRGQLTESVAPGALPVVGATVQLAWFDIHTNAWVPAPEQNGLCDSDGEFGAFLRLQPGMEQEADLQGRLLKIRLQFTRGTSTRATPDNFAFLADPKATGRVNEGQLLGRDLQLGWADLQPI